MRFMQAGDPGTTTPLPPCAIDDGSMYEIIEVVAADFLL
jgi:hypothetical protein